MIRIVIADDNRAFLEIVSAFLKLDDDIEVVGLAADGVEAIEQITALAPDIVLLDSVMPRLDGIAVLKQLRDLPEGRPDVIMITALANDSNALTAIENGAALIMLKPFDMTELIISIKKLYRMRNMFDFA